MYYCQCDFDQGQNMSLQISASLSTASEWALREVRTIYKRVSKKQKKITTKIDSLGYFPFGICLVHKGLQISLYFKNDFDIDLCILFIFFCSVK